MTIDQQLAAAEAQLTELQQRLVDAAGDPAKRGRIYDQIRATRREIDRLVPLQPTG